MIFDLDLLIHPLWAVLFYLLGALSGLLIKKKLIYLLGWKRNVIVISMIMVYFVAIMFLFYFN